MPHVAYVARNENDEDVFAEGPSDYVLYRAAKNKDISARDFGSFLARYDYAVTVGFYVTNRVSVAHPHVLQHHHRLAATENLLRARHADLLPSFRRGVDVRQLREACVRACETLLSSSQFRYLRADQLREYVSEFGRRSVQLNES